MNILFVSESVWMSGVVYDLHIMAEGLSMLGHKIYAVDPGEIAKNYTDSDLPCEFQKVSRIHSEACVHLKSPRLKKSYFGKSSIKITGRMHIYRFYKIYSEIEKVLRDKGIDIIVLYSAARSGLQTVRLAKKYNVPVVFRNVDMLYKLWPSFLKRAAVKIHEKYVYPRMDLLLALTPKYAEYLIKLGADKTKIELLPFPIDLEQFHPAVDCSEIRHRWGLDDNDQVIVFIGALYEFSGLVDFVRQFPVVLEQVPRAKLLIVGDGPIRPALEEIVDELNVREDVIITGHQPFSLMVKYVNTATICFSAFPINENTSDIFSAKVIQYLACGKATVSSALSGMTTMLAGESCGVVYVDDATAMAHEMISLLKSPERRERLGQAGLDYVRRIHNRGKVILKLEEELKGIIGKKLRRKLEGSFAYHFLKNICNEFLWPVVNITSVEFYKKQLFASGKSYENLLYNSANEGYTFYRAGQRINRISAGAVVNRIRLYMDKVGNPKGVGSCVVRKVSDDSIVGTFGTVDLSSLPDASASRPKWVLFNTMDIKIPNKGDYRIVFEWDTAGGNSANYPRVRYNNINAISGVFTQYGSEGKWVDHSNSDTSIKIHID